MIKARKVFVMATMFVLSAFTIPAPLSSHKAEARNINDCRSLITGSYLTTTSGDFGPYRAVLTFGKDGNFFGANSNANGAPVEGTPFLQAFGNIQGSWICTGESDITATAYSFAYPVETLPGTIVRGDINATLDPNTQTLRGTITFRFFSLNSNPLKDNAPVAATATFTGEQINAM